jgi:hypothetical protein
MTSQEAIHEIITRHPTPTAAPNHVVFLQAIHSHLKTTYIATLSIPILIKTSPSKL